MLDRITGALQFDGEALALRAQRQQVLASNIANADTPDYQARDFDFGRALAQATSRFAAAPDGAGASVRASHARATSTLALAQPASLQAVAHKAFLPVGGAGPSSHPEMLWRTPQQPSIDRNTVDLDRERASFADNSLRYEATLRFISGKMRNLLSAIRGD